MTENSILVTGAAGFIGFHVARELLRLGHQVVGVDSLNDYYDPALKHARLKLIRDLSGFDFIQLDLADRVATAALFAQHKFPVVIHLAAQAGVRYSLQHPHAYIDANLQGFANVLEGCRHNDCRHLLYASSSSVYGANTKLPFAVSDRTDNPVSLYAATKKANEVMAYSYSHLYKLPTTGLRFFTIYGPWYRPDMALYLFADAIVAGRPIKLFNNGKMRRDFTYVDDVTRVIARLIDLVPQAGQTQFGSAPARVYNVGNHHPEELMHVVTLLEQEFGRVALKEMLPMQPGDVPETFADVDDLIRDTGFSPSTKIADGLREFVGWYRGYFSI